MPQQRCSRSKLNVRLSPTFLLTFCISESCCGLKFHEASKLPAITHLAMKLMGPVSTADVPAPVFVFCLCEKRHMVMMQNAFVRWKSWSLLRKWNLKLV